MLPKISVIIPVFNNQDKLNSVLPSIFNQEGVVLEVIVVDDGSTEFVCIEEKYQERLSLVRQNNAGAPVARNTGAAKATGDYFFFWDADVEAKSNMLKKMYNALVEIPAASYAYCNYLLGTHKMPARAFDAEALKKQNYIATMSLIRKDDFPGFDPKLKRFQDWDLWLTMLNNGCVGVHVNEYLFTAAYSRGVGISSWLPSFAYKKPFCYLPWWKNRVQQYRAAEKIIKEKHHLIKKHSL